MLLKAPKNLTLLFAKGELLVVNKQFKCAEELFAAIPSAMDTTAAGSLVLLQRRIGAIIRRGDCERADELVQEFLQTSASMQEKLFLLDHLSCLPFMEELPNCLHNADRWSEQALEIQPQNLTLQGTRGAVLVEQCRFDEGEAFLKEVYQKSEVEIDREISAFYLALIAKRHGDRKLAARLARRARLSFPAPWLLKRLEAEFPKGRPDR